MGRVGRVGCLVVILVAGAVSGQPGGAPKAGGPPTVVEVLEERQDLLRGALQETLEDMAMLKAIREGEKSLLITTALLKA